MIENSIGTKTLLSNCWFSNCWFSNYLSLFLAILFCLFAKPLPAQTKQDVFPPTVRKEVGTKWKVTGKVTSKLGRPLSGVKIYHTQGMYYRPMSFTYNPKISEPVTTDFGGNYEINVQEGYTLIFVASGFAPLAAGVPEGSGLDVQMEMGRSISGTVTLPSGEPLANATVFPTSWIVPPSETEPDPESDDKTNIRSRPRTVYGSLPDFGKPLATKTDGSGKFTLSNLPTDYRVGLIVKAQGWKEKFIYVRPKDDIAPPNSDRQLLLEEGFEYPVEPCSLLNIKGTDEDGNPITIAEVSTAFNMGQNTNFNMRRTEVFNRPEISLSRPANPKGSIVYVQPEDSEGLLGVKLELPPNDEIEITEQEVIFRRGHTIRGRIVSDLTGEPIKGAKLKWHPIEDSNSGGNENELETQEEFVKFEIQTDQDGRFSFAVPNVDAIIGVVGKVEGYRTMPDVLVHRERLEGFAGEVFDRLTFDLKKNELSDLDPIEFRLAPCQDIDVFVVDEQGQPASNAVLAWSKKSNLMLNMQGSGFSMSHGSDSFSGQTDAEGKFKIKQLYDDDFFIAASLANSDKARQRNPYLYSFRSYPIAIQAFSIDGFKQGQGKPAVPSSQDETGETQLIINLLPGANVRGQVTDQNANAVADLEVTARSGDYRAGQTWTTQTRPDGWFEMQGLPPGSKLRWSLDPKRVKSNPIKIPESDLVQGTTITIDPVECMDYSMLLGELPEIEIGGLSNEDALQVLLTFIKDSHARIPILKENEDGNGMPRFSSWGSGDPVPAFKDKISTKTIPIIKELADREPGSDFELKLLISTGALLFNDSSNMRFPGAMSYAGTKASNFQSYFQQRLLKNHVNNEKAQSLMIQTAGSIRSYQDINKHLRELYEATPFEKTKIQVAARMLTNFGNKLRQSSAQSSSKSEFEKQLVEFEKMAKVVEQSPELLPKPAKDALGAQLGNLTRTVDFFLKSIAEGNGQNLGGKMDESRLKRVKKLADQTKEAIFPPEDN
jgi:hypothetical protein